MVVKDQIPSLEPSS